LCFRYDRSTFHNRLDDGEIHSIARELPSRGEKLACDRDVQVATRGESLPYKPAFPHSPITRGASAERSKQHNQLLF
jgi:hypothetical protein